MTRSPSAPEPRSSGRTTALALSVAGLVVLADQASKWLVRRAVEDLPFDVGWGFGIHLVWNRGVAFGRLAQGGEALLVVVAVLAAAIVAVLVLGPPAYRLGLGILLGGALGNLIDRVRLGAVVDFIDVPWWPTFNFADVAVVVGVVLVVWAVLRAGHA
ncbi:MAG TPA: signal peptidase II [Thermoleophilia bacterium]|nr:signal peptidase II [Thermoleophilia bacterium]HQJ96985.1 signal peptidase II [Thermoleophilia bacterium]